MEKSGTLLIKKMNTTSECLHQCSASSNTHAFTCKSVMWKRDTSDCILSRWSIHERRNAIRISGTATIDLYENTCLNSNERNSPGFSDWNNLRTTTEISASETQLLAAKMAASKARKELKEKEPLFVRARAHAHNKRQLAQTRTQLRPLDGNAKVQLNVETTGPHLTSRFPSVPRLIRPGPVTRHYVSALPSKATTPIPSVTLAPVRVPTSTEKSTMIALPASNGEKRNGSRHDQIGTEQDKQPLPVAPRVHSHATRSLLNRDIRQHGVKNEKRDQKSACFLRMRSKELPNFEEKTKKSISLRNCLLSCLKSTDFYCASVNYINPTRTCVLNGGNIHLNRASLISSTSDYYENICNPQTNTEIARKRLDKNVLQKCFEMTSNATIVSFHSTVAKGITKLSQCVSLCYFSRTPCFAFNWLSASKGCMLFNAKIDKSQLVSTPNTVFIENKCAGKTHSEGKSSEASENDYYDTSTDHEGFKTRR